MGTCLSHPVLPASSPSAKSLERVTAERLSLSATSDASDSGVQLWLAMPHGVLSQLAALLGPEDLASLALTCRELHTALQQSLSSCRPVYFPGGQLAATFPSLQQLDLVSVAAAVTDSTLPAVTALRGLSALSLAGCRRLKGAGLAPLTSLQLQSVDLSDATSLLDVGLAALAQMASLTSLTLQENDCLRPDGLQAVLAALPLQRLEMRGLRAMDNRALQALPGSACASTLTSLALRPALGDVPSPRALAAVCALTQLRRLSLVRLQVRALPRGMLAPLASLAGLTALELSAAVAGHHQALAALAEALPALRELHLGRAMPLDAGELGCLAELPLLTSLRLHIQLGEVSRLGGLEVLEELRQLRSVDATLCGTRRPRAVGRLCAALPAGITALALREQSSSAAEPFGEGGLAAASEAEAAATTWQGANLARLPELRALEVTCGDGLSQPLLEAIFAAPSLESLTLASTASPPGGALLRCAGLSRLTRLTALSLATPEGLGTDVLTAAGALASLQQLDLEANNSPARHDALAAWQLDARALAPLGCLRHLRHLKLWNASTLTRGGLERLAGLPALRTLFLLHCSLRAEAAAGALSSAHGLRRLVVHGQRVVASPKALDLLAPLANLTHLSMMNPLPSKSRDMWSGALGSKKTDPYHRISSELSEEVLTSFLEVHPVLQHYEFLKGQPNGNGVFGVRRVEGEVVVGSMWGGDA